MSEPLCTATLTTATVEPCPYTPPVQGQTPNCPMRYCDGYTHVAPYTLACVSPHPHGPTHRWARVDEGAQGRGVMWTDDVDGATPHVPTVDVTDAEIIASIDAMRATVLAAKQVAQEECDCLRDEPGQHDLGCEVEA